MAAAAADFPGLAKWLPVTGRRSGSSVAEQLATCCYVQSDTEGVQFATRAVTAREHDGGTHERKFTVGETLQ